MADIEIPTLVETPSPGGANVATLLAGIVGDLQALVAQQMRLTQQEIASNLRRRGTATVVLASGVMALFLALTMLSLGAAYGLHWATASDATDSAVLPMAACFAIVSVVLLSLSGGLIVWGRQMLRAIPPWQNVAEELFPERTPWTNDRK